MENDPARFALWMGGISLIFALSCASYIAWVNGGSRNLALGLGALAGAFLVFALQLLFELRGASTSTDFVVEFVVDYEKGSVRSPRAFLKGLDYYNNFRLEAEASKVLSNKDPPLAVGDAPTIARDLAIVSMLSYFFDTQYHWKVEHRRFVTSTGSALLTSAPRAEGGCSVIQFRKVQEQLANFKNFFADAIISRRGREATLCLPPNFKLELSSSAIILKGFVCTIAIVLDEPYFFTSARDPHPITGENNRFPVLPDGSPRYQTIDIAARATVEFSALRAQDRDLSDYQRWASRITDGLTELFAVRN